MTLIDRDEERETIDGLLAQARLGLSSAVVLRGEAGIGKTSLLDFSCRLAADFQIVRVVGLESEAGLPFAGLHRLLLPLLPDLDAVPSVQRDALAVACGLTNGASADLMLVGLGALSLVAHVASRRPMLMCVDDAHWLDHESLSALAFLGRRAHAESLVLLLAVRDGERGSDVVVGLTDLRLAGLARDDALQLLNSIVSSPVATHVAERVVTATGGNPLALTDLGDELSAGQLVGGAVLPEPLPVGHHLETHYLNQVRTLPADTQSWLLLSATEPNGDLGYITSGATRLGIGPEAASPAEVASIVVVRSGVTFRHPLVRSAIYAGATSADRRAAHRALADVITNVRDADHRAWHLAAACTGPDDEVAAELEAAADRARSRGGYMARAQFLTRAAELTPRDDTQAQRLLAAAEAALVGGAPLQAKSLLERVDRDVIDLRSGGHALKLSAVLGITLGEPDCFPRGADQLIAAAAVFGHDEPELARKALLEGCNVLSNLVGGSEARRTAESIASGIATRTVEPNEPECATALLGAFESLVTDGYEASIPRLRTAIAALVSPTTSDDDVLASQTLGTTFCTITWDDVSRTQLQARTADIARSTGALRELDIVLFCQSMAATDLGDLAAADNFLIEGHQMRSALGATSDMWEIYRHPELLAWHASTDYLNETIHGTIEAGRALGNDAIVAIGQLAFTILDLGRGDYAHACEIAKDLVVGERLGMEARALPNLVEAAERSGDREVAEEALEMLRVRTTASATPWALGLQARSSALLAADGDADSLYQKAVARLAMTGARADLARAHLLYGEWLRRRKRKADAREQLREAHGIFSGMGATLFIERSKAELAATGERARKRDPGTELDLTPQESQIARLAAFGDTNAEIGASLYISANTVDYHLRKVYRKLDVGSRRDLRRHFPAEHVM